MANEEDLLKRISAVPGVFGGKPIVRGRRLAVEHVLGMLAAGDDPGTILEGYPWLELEDIQACLVYARRLVGHERVEPLLVAGDGWSCFSIPACGAERWRNCGLPDTTSSGRRLEGRSGG